MSYLTLVAEDAEPVLLNNTPEFADLLAIAGEFGMDVTDPPTCSARNLVVRGLRFNLLDWGMPEATGDEPVLFMIHGGAVTAHTWDLVAVQLARHYRVITPDIRSHGDSEWARDSDNDHHEMMEDMVALIDDLGLPQLIIIGHSMGGALVERLALAHPDLTRAIGIIDFTPEPNYPGLPVDKIRLFDSVEHYVERASKYGDRKLSEVVYAARHELLERLDGKLMPKHDPRHPMGGPGPGYYPGTPGFEQMQAVAVPALVMWGKDSFFVTEEKCRRLAAAMPKGEVSCIDGAGHQIFLEQPQAFIDAINDFVSRV